MYFVFSVYSMIHNHYVRIYNQFASRELDVVFVDHSVGEKIENEVVEKMYVPARPMTEAYATGYFSVAYKERRKRSISGGNDQVPQYRSISPELDDMRDVGSHFYDRVLEVFNVENNNKGR